MTLIEMVEVISEQTKIPKTRVKRVLKALFRETRRVAMSGEPVKLLGFGRFEKRILKSKKVFGRISKARDTLRFKPYGE